jgi:RND family efflux transporter MFP subunit
MANPPAIIPPAGVPATTGPAAADPAADHEKPIRAEPDPLRYQAPKRLKLAGIIVFCVFLLILVLGLFSRLTTSHQLAASTNDASIPVVSIINPQANGAPRSLVLPGNVQAYYRAPIYAQVSGYLKQWYFDIGAKVKAGDVLASIETPDLDQQLLQAKANLASANANEELSATTARRWNELLAKDAVSQQDADEKNGDLAAKIAAVQAAEANLQGLQALEGFKKILAPFNGVVTARNIDVGALVTVGGQTPLFTVDDQHRLRIYVEVPQVYSAEVKPGSLATFTVPEYPGQSFNATLTSTASSIDPVSGSLQVEFQTDNAAGMLHPGDYAQVQVTLPQDNKAVTVPPSALLFRDSGMEAATLGPDNRVVIKQVTIGRDMGTVVEIARGLTLADKVIDNPPDSLAQGDQVRVANSAGTANAQ